MLTTHAQVALAAAVAALVVSAGTAGSLLAQTPMPTGAPTHAQMHQMMDAMHGASASQRMHEAMGPDGEQMMDQCIAMMGMLTRGGGMMGMMGRHDDPSADHMVGAGGRP